MLTPELVEFALSGEVSQGDHSEQGSLCAAHREVVPHG
jgi:hypothetical protein